MHAIMSAQKDALREASMENNDAKKKEHLRKETGVQQCVQSRKLPFFLHPLQQGLGEEDHQLA